MSAGRTDFPITDIMDLNYGLEVNKDLVKGGHSQAKRAGYGIRLMMISICWSSPVELMLLQHFPRNTDGVCSRVFR